jgi:hypothetical protein
MNRNTLILVFRFKRKFGDTLLQWNCTNSTTRFLHTVWWRRRGSLLISVVNPDQKLFAGSGSLTRGFKFGSGSETGSGSLWKVGSGSVTNSFGSQTLISMHNNQSFQSIHNFFRTVTAVLFFGLTSGIYPDQIGHLNQIISNNMKYPILVMSKIITFLNKNLFKI